MNPRSFLIEFVESPASEAARRLDSYLREKYAPAPPRRMQTRPAHTDDQTARQISLRDMAPVVMPPPAMRQRRTVHWTQFHGVKEFYTDFSDFRSRLESEAPAESFVNLTANNDFVYLDSFHPVQFRYRERIIRRAGKEVQNILEAVYASNLQQLRANYRGQDHSASYCSEKHQRLYRDWEQSDESGRKTSREILTQFDIDELLRNINEFGDESEPQEVQVLGPDMIRHTVENAEQLFPSERGASDLYYLLPGRAPVRRRINKLGVGSALLFSCRKFNSITLRCLPEACDTQSFKKLYHAFWLLGQREIFDRNSEIFVTANLSLPGEAYEKLAAAADKEPLH